MAKIQLYFAGQLLREYVLDDQYELKVGRGADCDIVIDSVAISRHHCTLREVEHHWNIIDEGSSNGCFVNGERIERYVLKHKDRVVIGKHTLMFDQFGTGRDPRRRPESAVEASEDRTMFVSPGTLSQILQRSQKQQSMGLVLSGLNRQVVPLVQTVTVIGSAADADLRIHGLFVKGHQAKVVKTDTGHRIIHGGGIRALRVNGEKRDEVALWAGDVITIAGNKISYGSL
ncbi:MAG: FHA domain-containing protein [Methylococcaceae bacterium]|nr:FHA domain-containing protein [Methylococcaceae bacterium]